MATDLALNIMFDQNWSNELARNLVHQRRGDECRSLAVFAGALLNTELKLKEAAVLALLVNFSFDYPSEDERCASSHGQTYQVGQGSQHITEVRMVSGDRIKVRASTTAGG
ncbi:MAG: hypothetical protein LC808_04540 [Actinobacteria bacterium]|nr:hypothetical protein [Actinomycetota bacterium]